MASAGPEETGRGAKQTHMKIARRSFLFLAGATFLGGEDRSKRDMLVRSVRPEDLEMPLSGFSDYITPIEHFFVRTHVYVPSVNASEWRLTIRSRAKWPGRSRSQWKS